MASEVTIVIPVLRGQNRNLRSCLQHLHDLDVREWAEVVVVSSFDSLWAKPEGDCKWIATETSDLTWGDLIILGMHHARNLGSSHAIWLSPCALPREGTLDRLKEVSRCRKAITAPGRVVFTCETRKSGGFQKTLCGLIPANACHGQMVGCDTISDVCACVPLSAIQLPETSGGRESTGIWTAQDLGLILTGNGITCLVDGESEVDVLRSHTAEEDSWLLRDQSTREIWKGSNHPASPLNPTQRLRFFARHWGILGILPAMAPLIRLTLISIIRLFLPVTLLRRIYGRYSVAWQIQQLYNDREQAADYAS